MQVQPQNGGRTAVRLSDEHAIGPHVDTMARVHGTLPTTRYDISQA